MTQPTLQECLDWLDWKIKFLDHPPVNNAQREESKKLKAMRYMLICAKHAVIANQSAAKTFRWYEEMHRAKPDHEKADRNRDFALEQEGILTQATATGLLASDGDKS